MEGWGKGFLLSLRRQRSWLACPFPGLSTSGPPLTPAPRANSVGKKNHKSKNSPPPPPGQPSCPYLDRGRVRVLLLMGLGKYHKSWHGGACPFLSPYQGAEGRIKDKGMGE